MGYSRAVMQGDWCFVSGVTGYDYATMTMPEEAAAQAENCFQTIESVLAEAGFSMADIARVQYTVTDRAFVASLSPVIERFLGEIRPAATMIIAGLIAPEMLIEVEVTAFRS
ncbi:MAG: RidA family protein [Pseudomonadota bacterium]